MWFLASSTAFFILWWQFGSNTALILLAGTFESAKNFQELSQGALWPFKYVGGS